MCLGLPGQIISLKGKKARVKTQNHCHWVDISALETPVKVGDYLISYQKVAINKIELNQAGEILRLFKGGR